MVEMYTARLKRLVWLQHACNGQLETRITWVINCMIAETVEMLRHLGEDDLAIGVILDGEGKR